MMHPSVRPPPFQREGFDCGEWEGGHGEMPRDDVGSYSRGLEGENPAPLGFCESTSELPRSPVSESHSEHKMRDSEKAGEGAWGQQDK